MTQSVIRQPKGQPTGGQFAAHSHSDSTVALFPHPMPVVGAHILHNGRDWSVERVDSDTAMLKSVDGDLTLVSEHELGLHSHPVVTTIDLIARADTEAMDEKDATGCLVTPTLSLVTDQGTAISESTLCKKHFTAELIDEHAKSAPSDAASPLMWEVSSGNDQTACAVCGDGYGATPEETNAEVLSNYRYDEVAGYMFQAEMWTPERLLSEYYNVEVTDAEEFLGALAHTRGIDRGDEHSFDSDDFPKVVLAGQIDPSEDLTWLGGVNASRD